MATRGLPRPEKCQKRPNTSKTFEFPKIEHRRKTDDDDDDNASRSRRGPRRTPARTPGAAADIYLECCHFHPDIAKRDAKHLPSRGIEPPS